MPVANDKPDQTPSPKFWDSLWALGLLVGAVLLARMYILEPFKIPSGSMEPTLFGHEDYGDRILTNKLAYVTGLQLAAVMAVSLLIILGSLAWSILYSRIFDLRKHVFSIVATIVIAVATVGGIGLSWARDAVAGNPQRFNVVVFQYNTDWNRGVDNKPTQNINYIKRLIGLPGDSIMIAGGDLFLKNKATGAWEILRRWQVGGPELQERLWYPVSRAWSAVYTATPAQKSADPKIDEYFRDLAFPWKGAEADKPGVKRLPKSLELDGSADVQLAYKYPVTNVYLKQGRWQFTHLGCPAASLPPIIGPGGVRIRNPKDTSEGMTSYVGNTWDGIQCTNCQEVLFPAAAGYDHGPDIRPAESKFFYGGDYVVGDLRLDMALNVETPGPIKVEVGNSLHRAVWDIGAGKPIDSRQTADGKLAEHEFYSELLTVGKHTLSLQYVDATVIAVLDGRDIERLPIDGIGPLKAREYRGIESVARVTFSGVKSSITKLDLYRDLYYTPGLPDPHSRSGYSMSQNDPVPERYYEDGNYVANIPPDKYLMMGDNSPSSSDGRVWGFVPKERLLGRAWIVWWPPSRWRLVK